MELPLFLDKALENTKAAQLCFDNHLYNACVNRAYYAMYQAAIAALAAVGVKPISDTIGHDWVQANFSRELINRRKLYAGFKNYLADVQISRNKADYAPDSVSGKVA